jgi:hypothetical protein
MAILDCSLIFVVRAKILDICNLIPVKAQEESW